MILTYHC